jgi:hypothetical protein
MVVGKVVAHLCLTLFIKELKFSVEHDRVVTTLNIIFSVVLEDMMDDMLEFSFYRCWLLFASYPYSY